VLHELAELGVKRAIRGGTCSSLAADPELTARLAAGTAEDPARIVSADLFYEGRPAGERPPRAPAETWRRRMGLLATAAMHAQP
jgi:uridine phosphorylase